MSTLNAALLAAAIGLAAPTATAASNDDTVEWDGLSHVMASDLTPVVPRRGDDFRVRFQTFTGDITGARVLRLSAGLEPAAFNAVFVANRGPYDIWEAEVEGVDADSLGYAIELTDGADTDYLGNAGPIDELGDADTFFLDFVGHAHAPRGSTPVDGGVFFRVWAPGAATAHVAGTWNGFNLSNPMTRLGDDFIAFVPQARAGHEYKYVFNRGTYKPDPRGRRFRGSFDNSVVVDRDSYEWTVEHFTPPTPDELVVYNIHAGTFAGRNDPFGPATSTKFLDVARRADYFVDLGVNCLYFSPVHEFPGDNSGGYNPMTAFGLESSYGTPDQFKYMVDQLHQRGIAVWVDIVYNHFDGGGSNFLWFYDTTQIYYGDPLVTTVWGPQADFMRPEVRDYFTDSVHYLLDELKIDGFRVDAVSAFTFDLVGRDDQQDANRFWLRGMHDLMDRRHAEKWSVAEIYGDDPFYTTPTSLGGIGFDAQYHQRMRDAVQDAVFSAAFGDPDLGRLAGAMFGSQFLQAGRAFNYFENHDDAWPLSGGQRAVRTIDPDFPHDSRWALGRTKLGESMVLLARGIPMILQGNEWAEDEGWIEPPGGGRNLIDWAHKTAYDGVWTWYKDLITLRTTEPALRASAPMRFIHLNEGANVMAFERWEEGGTSYVFIVNFSNTDFDAYRIGLPRPGSWGVIMNSESPFYDGFVPGDGSPRPITTGDLEVDGGFAYDGEAQSVELGIPAHSVLVLQHEPNYINAGCRADLDRDRVADTDDTLTFLGRLGSPSPASADMDGDGDGDFLDLVEFLRSFDGDC